MKLTEKQLLTMRKLVNNALNDCDVMTVEELTSLDNLIASELYVQQVKLFVECVDRSMPSSDDDAEKFYDMKWTIGFGGYNVIIDNEANIYQNMLDMLNNYIEDCL